MTVIYSSADFKCELKRVRRARTRNAVLVVVGVLVIVALIVWFLPGSAIKL